MGQVTRTSVLRAALWMSGAVLSLSVMAVAGRAAAFDLDTFEIMLYRSVLGLGIVLAVAGVMGRLGDIRAARLGLHAGRNLAHFAGQNLWFYAITVIPLAQVFANAVGTLFPVFRVSDLTVALQAAACLVVAVVAAAWPAWRMSRLDIVAGLRHVG